MHPPSDIGALGAWITARGRRRPGGAVIRKRVGVVGGMISRVQRDDSARKTLKLPLTSTWRQKQSQFESSSSNRGDVTSKLSRHRWHSFLPLREFDQQLGLLLGPFAGFCRLHV